MKLPTPNDIGLPMKTIDKRADEILKCFLNKISNDLVEGNFTKYINPCGTVEFVVLLAGKQIDADNVTYKLPAVTSDRLPAVTSDICEKIKTGFENNGWSYCFVDSANFDNSLIIKLYPIMPSWK